MRTIVQRTLIITFLYTVSISLGHAFDLDMTVDDEIRKNYNSSQLVNDVHSENSALNKKIKEETPKQVVVDENLPELPSISKYDKYAKSATTKNTPQASSIKFLSNAVIKSGKSFNVTSKSAISDWQRKGASVQFVTKEAVYGKNYTIPSGTVFKGEIVESHQPQITCNGGLVVIEIYSMVLQGRTIPVKAYITRANDKKIFFNNIKGERNYIKTTWKKGNWGRTLFNKMLTLTVNLGAEGATLVLSPFPVVYGTICLGLNTITSPICAFFSKGGHISIPANSAFRIKLTEDVNLN